MINMKNPHLLGGGFNYELMNPVLGGTFKLWIQALSIRIFPLFLKLSIRIFPLFLFNTFNILV